MLPLVIITTGATDLECARKCARQAIAELRASSKDNVASDLYQALAPFIGFL